MKRLLAVSMLALAVPLLAQETIKVTPGYFIENSLTEEWTSIPSQDLLVMQLAPDAEGNKRTVVIQLMPPPFSQGWVGNIRTLAKQHWWDGTNVYRVQDNYVVQWGGGAVEKAEPEGLTVVPESGYLVDQIDIQLAFTGEKRTPENEASWRAAIGGASEKPKYPIEQTTVVPTCSGPELERLQASPNGADEALRACFREETIYNYGPSDVAVTRTEHADEGWHQRDSYAPWTEIFMGWPLGDAGDAGADTLFWPVHCYGMVGVARGIDNTGSGSDLYVVIGHAPRQLDRNIALAGRVIEGIEHLSSLPRGKGDLGFYEDTEAAKRVPIISVRLGSEMSEAEQPRFEYLSTDSESFRNYVTSRAYRNDNFYKVPAGGVDICNAPVPVRRVPAE